MSVERAREVTGVGPLPRAQLVDDEKLQLRTRLTWLLVFRSAVMTVLLAASFLLRLTATETLFAKVAVALYAVAFLSYGSVLAGGIWMWRWKNRGLATLAYAQLAFDAFISSVIVVLTGGVESVFIFVYSLSVLNAAAVLQKRGALALAAVVTALYSGILALETSGLIVPLGMDVAPPLQQLLPPFLTNTASFVLVAMLAGFLSEQLKRTSESLNVARAQIERLEELYRAVLESLPSGVLTVDALGRIVYVNSAGAEILGSRVDELVGRSLGDRAPALTAGDTIAEETRFESVLIVEERAHPEATQDGVPEAAPKIRRERMIGGSVARLTGLEGMAGRVIVFQDLTELRRLQGDMARAERLAELGRFAAGLAHEIRNPLAAMIGCLQLLRSDNKAAHSAGATSATANGVGSDDGERMLGIVHREAERLSSLVTGFLTYARPSPPRVEPTPLLALAQETATAMRTGIDPSVELEVAGVESVALCDATQVRQALWNLIGNAAQAVHAGDSSGALSSSSPDGASGASLAMTTPRGRVRVTVRSPDDRHVTLTVDDDGPGVPADIRGRIFEPFFTTRADGTGLGLATVHQTLAQMRGTISLEDSPFGGARFVVTLPRAS